MKRNMKKHVSLLLAVLMLLTSVGFNVFAESTHVHEIDTNNPNYFKVVNPTCDEKGYTIYYCTACEGKVEANRGNYKDALGHVFDAGEFVPVDADGTSYKKVFTCTREYRNENGETVKCGHKLTETENEKDVVYYKVDFINNKVPQDYITDINGVKLINTATLAQEHLATYFVKEGTVGTYNVASPFFGKTKDFGKHEFKGWTTIPQLEIKNSYADSVYADTGAPITAKTVFYPVFEGQLVEHAVTFFSLEGQITNPQNVKHGESPVYRVNGNPAGELYDEPEKKEDIVNYYDFSGWSTRSNQKRGIKTLDVEKTPIYNKINYYPAFEPVKKNYRVEFYTYDHKLIKAFDDINLESNLLADKTVIDDNGTTVEGAISAFNNVKYLAKPSTASFNYEWTGKWRVLRAINPDGSDTVGNFVDLKNFKITTAQDFLEEKDENGETVYIARKDENGQIIRQEPVKVIRLIPEYDNRLVVYHVGVKMILPAEEDSNYYLGDAAVRIFDYNNQLVASGKTDADGVFRCKLNYIEGRYYTVKITTVDSKYLGESLISGSFQKDPEGRAEYEAMMLNVCSVAMTRNPEYETHCSCIHHNALLQPIWVRILNILHTFFNVKYECCYDMYSTIGPLLDYTKEG